MEKSLKAVLFTHQIEFRRTHNLTELTQLLKQHGIETPIVEVQLDQLSNFAVNLRYDDKDIQLVSCEDAANWVTVIRQWAENQINYAIENDVTDDLDNT